MISDLDLFAIVLNHVSAAVTLASREIRRKIEAMLKGTAFRLSGLLRVNCEAELRVMCYLTGRDPKSALAETLAREQKRIPGKIR